MIYVSDIETFPNFFLASFKDIETKQITHFEISDRKNDTIKLREFLLSGKIKYTIGFNWHGFDYPILHNTILKNNNIWSSEDIYKVVQSTINTKYASIKEREVKVPYIDLYKLWHYDNKNKATSLKWLEFAMRMSNIQDLPYAVGSILSDSEKDIVIKYCENDLNATEAFFYKSLKQLTLRKQYGIIEKANFLNSSEGNLAREIFSKALGKEMQMSSWDVKKLRTYRTKVNINEIIFDYIKFNDPINQDTLDKFKSKVWTYNDNPDIASESISFQVLYKNVIREYAEGGLHSACKSGIYESDDDYILYDVDFKAE